MRCVRRLPLFSHYTQPRSLGVWAEEHIDKTRKRPGLVPADPPIAYVITAWRAIVPTIPSTLSRV